MGLPVLVWKEEGMAYDEATRVEYKVEECQQGANQWALKLDVGDDKKELIRLFGNCATCTCKAEVVPCVHMWFSRLYLLKEKKALTWEVKYPATLETPAEKEQPQVTAKELAPAVSESPKVPVEMPARGSSDVPMLEVKKKPEELKKPAEVTDFVESDLKDEQQIMDELKGKYLEDFVYDARGKPQLAYAGIMQAVRVIGNIKIDKMEQVESTERKAKWVAYATDKIKNRVAGLGVCDIDVMEKAIEREKNPQKKRNLETQKDQAMNFIDQIAFSKAQRNVIKQLIEKERIAEEWFKKKVGFTKKRGGGADAGRK